ncbi:hypothetical protein L916_14313 [Phytophthora nicotianae]|uniref:BED-type domain-containing protein n=1 Tax=Phytophthora nicotianae TaxID=4792 RepID=W2IIK8_PHYNI|nr:hypothetical protein L916_14313 [Phytophthora nicotianae]
MIANLVATTQHPQPFTPRQIAAFFFKPVLDEEGEITGYHACKACGKRRKHAPGSGYTNLVTHVRASHPRFESEMRDASAAATGTLVPWVSQKASNRYAWFKWVVEGNLPLTFCENTNLAPVSVGTLISNMEDVTKAVERAIGEEMPDEFGIMLDDWSHGTEHFLAVYACYDGPNGPSHPLLSMAPIMEEPDDQLSADGHLLAIERGCKFLVGDNCSVNKRLADIMGVPLVGCASHRLNLAVRDYLAPHELALEEVQQLMCKLRTLKQAAKLRLKTSLVPIMRQDTRWSSTFMMLKRYYKLQEFLSADDDELADMLPSRTTHRQLEGLLSKLRCVESVSKMLQSDGLTLLDARDFFDGLLEVRPSMSKYLAPDADTIHPQAFEAAVVKVFAGKTVELTARELAVLEPFRQLEVAATSVSPACRPDADGFALQILKRRKISTEPARYKLLSAIPPTSNVVERLFSVARAVLRLERHRMPPLTLEMIYF